MLWTPLLDYMSQLTFSASLANGLDLLPRT